MNKKLKIIVVLVAMAAATTVIDPLIGIEFNEVNHLAKFIHKLMYVTCGVLLANLADS